MCIFATAFDVYLLLNIFSISGTCEDDLYLTMILATTTFVKMNSGNYKKMKSVSVVDVYTPKV